jgi:hypothetical protein
LKEYIAPCDPGQVSVMFWPVVLAGGVGVHVLGGIAVAVGP